MKLPPGATLADPGTMKLPPGATLVSGGASAPPAAAPPQTWRQDFAENAGNAPFGVDAMAWALGKLSKYFVGRADLMREDPGLLAETVGGAERGLAKTASGASQLLGGKVRVTPAETDPQNLPEKAGDLLRMIAEFEGGARILGAAGEAMSVPQYLSRASRYAKALEEFPFIKNALANSTLLRRLTAYAAEYAPQAMRTGGLLGAQTYVDTAGDTRAAAESAAFGGVTGMILPGAQESLARKIEAEAAMRDVIAGEATTIPGALRTQRLTEQQRVAQQQMRNVAGQTLARHLDVVNESRVVPPEPTPVATPAAGQGARNVAELGSTAATVPESIMGPKAAPEGAPPPMARPVGGEAARELGSTAATIPESVMGPKAVPEERGIVTRPPNFQQIDVPNVVSQVGSHTEAVEYLENLATEGYDRIADQLEMSGESRQKFNTLRNANKEAWVRYTDASTEKELAKATEELESSKQAINDLLLKDIGGRVTPQELEGINYAYGTAQKLKPVAKAIDGAFRGNVSPDKPWDLRVLNGMKLTGGLNRLMARPGGAEELYNLVGRDNVNAMYEIGRLNMTPKQQAAFGTAMSNIHEWLSSRVSLRDRYLGATALGGYFGHLIGGPWGGAIGATVPLTYNVAKKMVSYVLNNPKVANFIVHAIENGIPPKVYAPIIGQMIQSHAQSAHVPEQQQ
jgi:hypothetical protein